MPRAAPVTSAVLPARVIGPSVRDEREPELGGEPEVVLQVPGRRDPAAGQAVEVRRPELDRAPGAGDAEQLTGVDAPA